MYIMFIQNIVSILYVSELGRNYLIDLCSKWIYSSLKNESLLKKSSEISSIYVYIFMIGVLLLAASGCSGTDTIEGEDPTTPIVLPATSAPLSPSTNEPELPSSISFERIDGSDGLSSNSIRRIYQDRTGYLWIGTQDGLNKYNGYDYQVFRHDPETPGSLRDNFIETIYEDRNGVIWIGTQSGWLEKFDPETDSFTHYQIGNRILSLWEDRSGKIWIGTFNPGLFVFDKEMETADLVLSGENFSSIIEDALGQLWIASPVEGLFTADPSSGDFKSIPIAYPVTQMVKGSEKDIWLATLGGGIRLLNPAKQEITQIRSRSSDETLNTGWIRTIYHDAWGRIWFGTWDSGLQIFFPETQTLKTYQNDPLDPYSLSNNDVVSILVDRTGVLWVGNEFGGINKASLNSFDFGYYHHQLSDPNSLADGIVTSFAEDQGGRIWIGTLEGLSSWDRVSDDWRNFTIENADLNVRSLYVDHKDQLWVGTEADLYRFDRDTDQLIPYDAPVVMWMTEDAQGNFWMATKEGLYKFYPEIGEFEFIFKGVSWKIMVYEDSDGNIWVGSSGDGVDVLDPVSGDWHHYEHDPENISSLNGNFVETIHQDSAGDIWIGTNNGLNKFDNETKSFSHYLVPDGLPHKYVLGILEDQEGVLWLSTLGGLSRFDPRAETFTNFYRSDGLQGNTFWRNSYTEDSNGMLYFGGVNGFNAFIPGQIEKNPNLPAIIITSIRLYNQPAYLNIQAGDQIKLSYQENFLSFDFASLDYTDPNNNQFAYQMEGIDEGWVEIGNRNHVDYPNLDPGEYTFRVIGSNNDGVWNQEGAWVAITITPPFWMTWWFRIGMLAVLLLTLFTAYRMRIRQMATRNLELERKVGLRTKELRQEIKQREEAEAALIKSEKEKAVLDERNRLARELHDAVTQSLFSASLLAEAIPGAMAEDPTEAAGLLSDLRGLNKGALAEMRTLLLELRPGVLGEVTMADLLRQLSEAAGAREDFDLQMELEEGPILPLEVHSTFYRVAQEALNNIIKHAQPDIVSIEYRSIPQADGSTIGVELIIKDNGSGFNLNNLPPGSMGLGIMEERAQAIGADYNILSQEGEGTKIELSWTGIAREGTEDG